MNGIPGTTGIIQPLETTNNLENLSPANQRTNPGGQAQNPATAKGKTLQPETKRQVL